MTWLDKGGCSQCKSCGMDMDMDMEPFCVKPEVLAAVTLETGCDYPYGLYINSARQTCKGEHFEQHPLREQAS